ncbi:aminoacyl--tRNA ligase-related protein [Marinicrinis sediminis]|uniref:Aminoacyl--tRNA ligase-related protein n=1 Tax=Marinicrinis sediminis TaxID=1652465 RepID=A0ABW5RE62_9BACL
MIMFYPLSKERDKKKARQILDSVYYLSEDIEDVRLTEHGIEVAYQGEQVEEMNHQLTAFMKKSLQNRFATKSVIRDNRDKRPESSHFSMATHTPSGGLHLTHDLVLLEHALDGIFRELALKHGAKLRRYPSFFSRDQMARSGYLEHFPQHVYGLSEIPHDEQKLADYRALWLQTKEVQSAFESSDLYLQPCLCFHVYDELATVQQEEGLQLFSAEGPCYRHEHRGRLSPSRLREFRMREIVYVGEGKPVADMRDQLIEDAWSWFQELGLRGYVETATDPFYFHEDHALMFFQSSGALKYELRFQLDDNTDFSIASFNLCGHVLCNSFGVQSCYGEVHSGCTGFGIDRWLQAIVAVHGNQRKQWPEALRLRCEA